MPKEDEPQLCPHCGQGLSRWKSPPMTSWGDTIHFVCFNDECPYFIKGWSWMKEKYNVKSSFRHRCDSVTGQTGPLPVWSADALKGGIIDESGESPDS